MTGYRPPFEMTDEIVNLIADIAELTGVITFTSALDTNPTLRRGNRIKAIYSSLAIEQNTLSIDQVTDVINGKRVLAPPSDIKEVQNAYAIYDRLDQLDPYSIDDLLAAHKVMTDELVKDAGMFRSGNVGIYDGENLIHAGTPAEYVPEVIAQLFTWLRESDYHPLVKSCVFHYEFEYIHPFADGNGRMGRLWHTLILSKWKPFFAWLPVESLIHDNQKRYYEVLAESDSRTDAGIFVKFMLDLIEAAMRQLIHVQDVGTNVGTNVGINAEKILVLLKDDPNLNAAQLAGKLGLTSRQVERLIADLKKSGKLKRTGANKNGYWEVLKRL